MNHNVNMEIPAATDAEAEAENEADTNNSCSLNDEPMDQQQENLHDDVCIPIPAD